MEAHMELDDTIAHVKQLISQREAINAELAIIFGGGTPSTRKPQTCGKCGEPGHTARTCTKTQE
jgi:hypothetical protein